MALMSLNPPYSGRAKKKKKDQNQTSTVFQVTVVQQGTEWGKKNPYLSAAS
jgi:hypothetical protein